MTDVRDDALPQDGTTLAKEEAQRRIEEIMGGRDGSDTATKSRRTRGILVALLILLLVGLCGAGVFLYRLLDPGAVSGDRTDLAGITWIRSIYGYGPADEQQFINPNDAATGPEGTVWVADPGHSQVVGFRGDGTFVDRVVGSKDTGEPFRVPSRIAVDADGILYVVDRPNETLTIMDGQRKLVSANIPGVTAVDVNDSMVVAGSKAGFAILDKDGNVKTIVGTWGRGEDQFDTVGGVAIDSASQTIYVVDTFNNRLSAWDYAGKRKWIVALGNAGNQVKLEGGGSLATTSTAAAQLQLPTDITVDGRGRPVILDGFDFTLSVFDPNGGQFLEKWGTFGEEDGQFMYPSGFNYDASKDWFVVADTSNNRAQIIRIEGTGAEGMAGVRSWLDRLLAGPARALWPCLVLLPLLVLVFLIRRWRNRSKQRNLEAANTTQGQAEPFAE